MSCQILPDLSNLIFVKETEEDQIRYAAEEALNYQYDMGIQQFYEDARERAAALTEIYDEGAIRLLFEPHI